ncbi:hypothetical protein [Cytophaga aurantiaca]|uniref:hypothetical protein n=1 Tax=Cytophaga aurantiaca TaxID=29530 RepID=UPI00037EFBC8|nr:hypothetical protein [Cytophaga aurantiaca]
MNNNLKFIRSFAKILLLYAIYIASEGVFAQNSLNNFILNPQPYHFLPNKGQFLASSYDLNKSLVTVQYQNKIGIFSDIRNIYVDGIVKSKQGHIIGLKIYSEQETSLYSKSKMYFVYGYTIHINDDLTWTSAAQVGAVNIAFGASAVSAGGSAWNWDASLASSLQYKKWHLGIGLNQIPGAKLTPINYEFHLNRYVETILSRQMDVSPFVEWELGTKVLVNADTLLFSIDNKISYQKKMGALVMANSFKQVSLGGFVDITKSVGVFTIAFNYGFSFSGVRTNQSQYCATLYFKR